MTKVRILQILIILLMLLVFALGMFMVIGPMYDSYQARQQISLDVSVFKELIEETKPVIPDTQSPDNTVPKPGELEETPPAGQEIYLADLREAMEVYNEDIYHNGQSELIDAWSYQSKVFDLKDYGYPEKVIGLVTIPRINVEMPLYLGASYSNLSKGFAQLSQTSMPIGGINTNCVIAGHRGYAGTPHLRDVEGLEIGDSVYITNPWETLEYRVISMVVIQPHETQYIMIKPGQDLVTLVTCHPYGVGSHRYIVICERYDPNTLDHIVQIPESKGPGNIFHEWERILTWRQKVVFSTDSSMFESSAEAIFIAQILPWLCLAIILLVLLVSVFMILFLSKRKKAK